MPIDLLCPVCQWCLLISCILLADSDHCFVCQCCLHPVSWHWQLFSCILCADAECWCPAYCSPATHVVMPPADLLHPVSLHLLIYWILCVDTACWSPASWVPTLPLLFFMLCTDTACGSPASCVLMLPADLLHPLNQHYMWHVHGWKFFSGSCCFIFGIRLFRITGIGIVLGSVR